YGFSRSQHREHGSDMADYQYFIVDRQDEVTVVQMRQSPGDDAVSVAAWRDELVDLLTTEDPEKLLIDFERIDRFPSVAAASLLGMRKHLREEACVKLSGLNDGMAMTCRFLQFDRGPFTMHAKADEALASF
ncbi:MAG: hypothetical protein KDA71_08350, partial [Planctomycetales bacterium]|nr:hypothetical protein [Planctomycetales bacterium]